MRKFIVVLGIVLLAGLVQAQVPIYPTQGIAFDYEDSVFAQFSITRFEVTIDGGNYTSINIPPKIVEATSTPGFSTYRLGISTLSPMTIGVVHNISFRACNVSGCSGSGGPFFFQPVIIPAPGAGRLVP